MAKRLSVLYVEDSEDDVELVLRLLRASAYEPTCQRVDSADSLQQALEQKKDWDLIIGDFSMPNFSGTKALEIVRDRNLDILFIFVSGTMGEERAVEAMKAGAQDYIVKGNYRRLIPAIDRELQEAQLRREHARAERERREMEAQLRQAQKMETVGQLTGGVAHDFNNLLTVILGNLQMVEMTLEAGSKPHAWAEHAIEAAIRGAELTNKLLVFSQQQLLKPDFIDLNETIQSNTFAKMGVR
jgi:DNA-binding NtrC family response regulator